MTSYNTNQFQIDVDNMSIKSNNDQFDHFTTIIYPKLIQHNSKYLGHILMTFNYNRESFIKFLAIVDTNSHISYHSKYVLLKTFLSLSSKLKLDNRLSLTKSLWNVQSFRNIFKSFNLLMHNTSIKEKHNGPFCSLYSNEWAIEYHRCIDALTPLLSDTTIHSHIFAYINNFINLNLAYVEGDFENIEKNCSSIDFNCMILYILFEMKKYVVPDNKDILDSTTNKAINIMYIPLVNIKHAIHSQLSQTKGTLQEYTVKNSLQRLTLIYNDETITNFIKDTLPSITKYMDTTYELRNMCLYILEKFENNYTLPQLIESVGLMKDYIINNNINNDTVSIFLDLSIKKVKINIDTHDTKKIINGIMTEFLNGDDEIVNNIDAFTNLLSIFEEYGELSLNNHSTLHKMLKKMNTLIDSSIDTYILKHKSNVLTYYMNITKALIIHLQKQNGWLEPSKCAINNAVSIFVLFSLLKIPEYSKESIIKILIDCITLCDLTKTEASILKIKLKSFMTHELSQAIEGTLNRDNNDIMMYDFLFPEKKIVNPIFIPIDNQDVVIDSTTLSTEKLNAFIQDKITLQKIMSHNNTPCVILKKIELIGLLNSHVSKI